MWQHQGVHAAEVPLEGPVCCLLLGMQRSQRLLLLVVEVLRDGQLLQVGCRQ